MLRRRHIGTGGIAVLAAIGVASIAGGQTNTVLVPGTQAGVDYHAEGQIIGGNIHIRSVRAPDEGQALQSCDPDPRQAPNLRPDCGWATPAGNGEDHVDLNGQIGRPDKDLSPNGAFTPNSSDSREDLDGEGGLNGGGGRFLTGDLFEDEDMRFTLRPRSIDAYLAPAGDANNRWRRICGTAVVGDTNNETALSPFLSGQVRQFVVQIWDADWRDPSDNDGGNQDYYVLDVLAPGSVIDTATCDVRRPGQPGQPGQPGVQAQPGQPGAPQQQPVAQQAPAQQGVAPSRRLRGSARLAGRGGCVRRAFNATVTGSNIAQVVFSVDGRRVKTLLRADEQGRWKLRVTPRTFKAGRHRVSAGVSFVVGATPRVRRVNLTFVRCLQQRPAPQFTG